MRPEKVDRVVRKREAMKTSDTTEDILEPPETMVEPKYRN